MSVFGSRGRLLAVTPLLALGIAVPAGATASAAASAQAGPESPASIAREVQDGTLLRTHGVRRVCGPCDAEVVTAAEGGGTPISSAVPAGYGPSGLAAAYHLPTAAPTSTATIAIIDAGVDGHLASDLATYRRQYKLPACTVASGCLTLEDYTGGRQPAPQKGGQGAALEEEVAVETSLDLDMASAACGSCHLLEISVPWQDGEDDNDVSTGDFAQAVNTAVAAHASVVSISYGYTADVTNTSGSDLAAFRHKGVAITVSTGDSGFNGGIHQTWPANLPTAVAVGGVTMPTKAGGKATAWFDGGSGCETRFKAANGQPSAVTALCGGHRAAADVSAEADPNTGVAVYDTYAPSTGQPADWTIVGGTSASAPYIGGLYARAGHLASVEGPNTLYAAPAADFTDITSGTNEALLTCASYPGISKKLCDAGTGWDGPTGIGVPDGLGAF
ncbi:MAG TPA: S8 family serine peptidase [Actinospica sp.]|nr:S8 family serine peptidase [Actinospica sp.]